MRREMDEQPDVLQRIADSADEIRDRVRAIVPESLGDITFVGRGSSDNAAMLGRYASELAAHRPAGLAAPSLHTRYASRVDYRGYLVIGLSQSGATPEVVATCERLRASGAVVVNITNDDNSALAAVSHLALSTVAGTELAVPATKTVTAEMAWCWFWPERSGTVWRAPPSCQRFRPPSRQCCPTTSRRPRWRSPGRTMNVFWSQRGAWRTRRRSRLR